MKNNIFISAFLTLVCMFSFECCRGGEDVELLGRNTELKALVSAKAKALTSVLERNRDLSKEKRNFEKCVMQMESVLAAIKDPVNCKVITPEVKDEPVEVIVDEAFDGSKKWAGLTDMEDGKKALKVAVKEDEQKKDRKVAIWLPVNKIRGGKLKCTVRAKGVDISQPKVGYLGGKFLLMVNTPGKTLWPDASIGGGSFDWRKLTFTFEVPYDVRSVALFLGLQGVSGTIYFRDLKVELIDE